MKKQLFILSALAFGVLTLCSCIQNNGSATAANTDTDSVQTEAANAEADSEDVKDGTVVKVFVPENITFVKGIGEDTKILKSPGSDVCLMWVDLGEGSYNIWSDQKAEDGMDVAVEYFCDYNVKPVLSTKNGYFEIPVADAGVGYVSSSKCKKLATQPVTAADLESAGSYTIVKSGKYKGLIVEMNFGEGGAYYQLGVLDSGYAVFAPHKGWGFNIDFLDEASFKMNEDTYMPELQVNSLSEEQMDKFVSFVLEGGEDTESDGVEIITKDNEGLRCVYVSPDVAARFCKVKKIVF
ncbi:MAG: hypothetical protein KBT29_04230 [Prevotellaceae bacterium]|nr:hypothetical protein [Candidatus Minthosoma caballi]